MTISDSPRFLSYIYSKRFFNYTDKHSRAALVRIYESALESLNDYNVIYLFPPSHSVEQDGVRCQNENDADNLFNDIKTFLDTHAKELTVFINQNKSKL